MSEIVNRVKDSGLITIDLAQYKNQRPIQQIDIADRLWQGLALREKEFRTWIKEHDWTQYDKSAVHIVCTAEAIIPTWAYMLIASKLNELGITNIVGSKGDLEKKIFILELDQLDLAKYKDGRIIIKGCSDLSSPEYMMSELIGRLQSSAKSIMYGEPCSTVPIFKRK